jgi:hypothetical protein
MTLHNSRLDSRASHNLIPKVVMDQLDLDITRPYKIFSSLIQGSEMLGPN